MTLYHGISLILLSLITFIVGMIKPKWILFWMEIPTRLMVTAIAMVLFMIGTVLFGEGNEQKKLELQKQAQTVQPANPAVAEKPAPAPAPVVAPPPAQAPSTSANELRP